MRAIENSEDQELTIVSRRLLRVSANEWESPGDQFQRLRGAALSALLSAVNTASRVRQRELGLRVLLLLDCMLRVIGEPPLVSTLDFATPRFKNIQELFCGALGSNKFINVATATRRSWAETFSGLVQRLSKATQVHLLELPLFYRADIPPAFVQAFEAHPLDNAEVLKLRPFMLRDKFGVDYNVLLGEMVPVLGRPFTESFHSGLRAIARPKAKDSAIRDFGTTFTKFIAHRHVLGLQDTPDLLQSASYVQTLLVDFMEYHFMKLKRRKEPVQEGSLSSLQKLWSRYRIIWMALAREGVFAAPTTVFPAGNPKLLGDNVVAHRKIAASADGTTTVVTQKLLLPIPLQITDEEATQLIFKTLRFEFLTVQSWLRRYIDDWLADYDKGCALADSVDCTLTHEDMSRFTKQEWKEPFAMAIALRYFKTAHNGYVDTSTTGTVVYPYRSARDGPSKEQLSRLLGLPTRREAMALMAFLASTDGRFTDAAMSSALLLDGDGRRINAVETDGGLTLSVLKERAAGDGWHNVALSGEAAMYVRRWIQLTQPIRAHMRQKGLPGWRNLFIYLSNPLGAPKYFLRSSNINSYFQAFANSNEHILGAISSRVTIPRIRATRGVLVFLESMDLAAMARELGNSTETSLRHYLPDSLWAYFATRWLRIFQNLIIVAATKDTPYLQRAMRFTTAAELDEFLRNHAVTPIIPPDDAQPSCEPDGLSEVMVPASYGLFAMLLSISAATVAAESRGRTVAAQAIYWTEFIQRLAAFIESSAFHDRKIKHMLRTAHESIDPAAFEEVVCA